MSLSVEEIVAQAMPTFQDMLESAVPLQHFGQIQEEAKLWEIGLTNTWSKFLSDFLKNEIQNTKDIELIVTDLFGKIKEKISEHAKRNELLREKLKEQMEERIKCSRVGLEEAIQVHLLSYANCSSREAFKNLKEKRVAAFASEMILGGTRAFQREQKKYLAQLEKELDLVMSKHVENLDHEDVKPLPMSLHIPEQLPNSSASSSIEAQIIRAAPSRDVAMASRCTHSGANTILLEDNEDENAGNNVLESSRKRSISKLDDSSSSSTGSDYSEDDDADSYVDDSMDEDWNSKKTTAQKRRKKGSNSNHGQNSVAVNEMDWPFTCERCDKRFKQKVNLKYHVESAHEENPRCKTCNKEFKTKRSLQNHNKSQSHLSKTQPELPPGEDE